MAARTYWVEVDGKTYRVLAHGKGWDPVVYVHIPIARPVNRSYFERRVNILGPSGRKVLAELARRKPEALP